MKPRPTISDYSHLAALNPQIDFGGTKTSPPAKQSSNGEKKGKYGNVKVEVEGELIDSKKEAKRFKELRILLKAGQINQLSRQTEYELNPGGAFSFIYKADFVYIDCKTGLTIVEDVKGYRTREYLKKKRLLKQIYSIEIKEV